MKFKEPAVIIDVSQPVRTTSACFPGDVPFSREITLTYAKTKIVNLSALRMSPHVGTHADAPVHVQGSMDEPGQAVGELPLRAFIGPAYVVDLAPTIEPLSVSRVQGKLDKLSPLPPRLLFKTARTIRYDKFEDEYAHFNVDLIHYLADRGTVLVGIDTPSVDHVRSKSLAAHHALVERTMYWLENLDLTRAEEGDYYLVAAPLKFMELEASPVRALLLRFDEE